MHTIVPTNSKERNGYPTQKPLGILKRIITASSNTGDLVLDFFAGSGTTGDAAISLFRNFILVDNNPEALEVMDKRFSRYYDIEFIGYEREPHQEEQNPQQEEDSKDDTPGQLSLGI